MKFSKVCIISLILSLSVLAIYVSTLTKNWSDDAIRYAYLVENSTRISSPLLYHPHHLLYSVTGFLAHSIATAFFHCPDTILNLQVFNAILAALAVIVFFVFLRTIGINLLGSFLFCLGLSFAYTVWACATGIEPQIAPQLFYLLILIFLTRIDKTRFPYMFSAAIGLLYGTAILFHQSSIFFAAPILIGLFLFLHPGKRYKCIMLYMLFSTLTGAGAYAMAAVYILDIKNINGFFRFLTYYHHIHVAGLRFFEFLNIPRSLYMLFKILLYAPFTTIRDFSQNMFSHKGLLNIIAMLSSGVIYIASFILLWKTKLPLLQRKVRTIAVFWLIAYLAYIIITEAPYCIEQYLNIIFPVWILLALSVYGLLCRAEKEKVFHIIVATLVLFIFLWNYSFFVVKSKNIDNNLKYKNAILWKGKTSPRTAFLTFGWEPYFEYFARREIVKISDYFPDKETALESYNSKLSRIIEERIDSGNNVYLLGFDIVLNSQHVQDYLFKVSKTYTIGNIESFFSQYRLSPIETEFGRVYKIEID